MICDQPPQAGCLARHAVDEAPLEFMPPAFRSRRQADVEVGGGSTIIARDETQTCCLDPGPKRLGRCEQHVVAAGAQEVSDGQQRIDMPCQSRGRDQDFHLETP
ncbi:MULTISPECIES: hypothetical protein [Methylobacterium]|uniref:hypothetical protein n=1 Tax=Methylobacterium TaxID=407 RepID=UPI0031F50ECA